MPTAFATSWDSYTNSLRQHYVPVDFKRYTPPTGKTIILDAYTAEVVRATVAREEHFDAGTWDIVNVYKPDDEHLFIVMRNNTQPTRLKSVALRWHF